MQNEQNQIVDLYIPRRCKATGRLVPADDHGAVQFNVALVDENDRATNDFKPVCISGKVRRRGESDDALNRMFRKLGWLTF